MNRLQGFWPLVAAGVLLWLLAVLPAYYVMHKPLTGQQAAALAGVALDLVLLAATVSVAAAWGSRLCRWAGIQFATQPEQWTLAAMLGLGLLGTVVLALGAAGGLYRLAGYAVLVALGATALPDLRAQWRWLAGAARSLRTAGPSWLGLYVGVIGALALGLALLPPTSWDALAYHLEGPRQYVAAHRVLGLPESFYLNWPAQVEMLFTWGLLLKGDTLAQVLNWAFWPLTAALLYLLGRHAGDARCGRWAAGLWASVPLAGTLATWPYVDLALAAWSLAAFYALMRWTETEAGSWLGLSAVFAGLGLATKYTAATWLLGLGLLLIYHARRHQRRPARQVALLALKYVALAGLVAGPWLLKNWLVTGNPIYPLAFGGAYWNSAREQWTTLGGFGYSRSPLDYLALPWLMTVLGLEGTGAFDATIGPLLLALVPLVLLFRGRPRPVNYGLWLVATQALYFCYSVFRYAFMAQTRLLFPIFPLLCLAAAWAIHRLPAMDRPSFRLSRVVGGIVVLVLAANLAAEGYAFLATRPLQVLAGLESRRDYLSRRLGAYYEAARYAADSLPAEAQLLFLWEPRAYYSRLGSDGDTTLDHLTQLRLAHAGPEAALAALRAEGRTHLFVYRTGLDLLRAPTPRAPTLGSLFGRPPAEHSFYPIEAADIDFGAELLARCRLVWQMGNSYEIYELP